MRQDHEVQVGAPGQQILGELGLGAGGAIQDGTVARVVGELARQLVRDPEAEIGMQRPEQPDRNGVARDPVHHLRAPVLEEVAAPAVVVPADERDRHAARPQRL